MILTTSRYADDPAEQKVEPAAACEEDNQADEEDDLRVSRKERRLRDLRVHGSGFFYVRGEYAAD
jgi:hypothetical protein